MNCATTNPLRLKQVAYNLVNPGSDNKHENAKRRNELRDYKRRYVSNK